MLREAEEFLTRQFEFLLRQEREHFYAQLTPYLAALDADARIGPHLRDLRAEGASVVEELRRFDEEQARKAIAVRDDFARRFPDLDDSQMSDPEDPEEPSLRGTLWYFDRRAGRRRPALEFNSESERWRDISRSKELLDIIWGKVHSNDDRWSDLKAKVHELRVEHHATVVEFKLALRVSAGIAVERLFRARRGWDVKPRAKEAKRFDFEPIIGFYVHEVDRVLFDDEQLEEADVVRLERGVSLLKNAARRSYEELRRRIGTVRSHRALVDRFKLRCESYDRTRLGALVDGKTNPENRLVDEAAKYLFDAGLTPLIGPRIGGFRPDAFDPAEGWTFYLEAKQYKSEAGARAAVREGAKQVWDTAAVLKSLDLREAFFVIFRRDGPLVVPPEVVRVEGLALYPVVIDIADPKKAGSAQRHRPISLGEGDFLPRTGPQQTRKSQKARPTKQTRPTSARVRARSARPRPRG